MATGYSLPPPTPLEIHDPQAADKWKRFRLAWDNYSLATELSEKDQAIQVATLLTVIGEEAREVFSTFKFTTAGNEAKIKPVLDKFEAYCQPRKNIPFERYRFNRRMQEAGESYDQYSTALRKIAAGCEFTDITPDEILRDRLVFGIRDNKVRERLLRESALTLDKTNEICHAAESMNVQMKMVEEDTETKVNVVSSQDKFQKAMSDKAKECWNCGRRHEHHQKELCPAYGKVCRKCKKLNHFAVKCRSAKNKDVKALEEDGEETFPVQVATVSLDDAQLVTLKLESGKCIRFQPDTGAQCNVLPVDMYRKATGDHNLTNVLPAETRITAYGGHALPVVGQVLLHVWRGSFRCRLDCKLVDSSQIRPLLGRKACLGMKIVSYLDNDKIHPPALDTVQRTVHALENQEMETMEQLVEAYPEVFAEGVGLLEGKYHIRIDPAVEPTQDAPRRVPVALRDRLKTTLDDMVCQEIIAPVTEPTPWISSMVVVPKKNGTLRICLDPQNLNKAILREHYALPTIEDIATRLHGAKLFTILDVRCGFWHVELDEPSSYLTTFQTPFGRYR